MPIYPYKCTKCAKEFEIIQKMSDNPLVDCDDCMAADGTMNTLVKVMTTAAAHFKGSGFYETDYKKRGR